MLENYISPRQLIDKLSLAEHCLRAEQYYQTLGYNAHFLSKPFSLLSETPQILSRFALLIDGLRLGKTMTVLDFGAGTCWLSRILNQLQCATISVDPSATALEIGKRLFAEYPIVGDYVQPPQFRVFDGQKLPMDDESVDRIACFDVFHHVPNQKTVLEEFFRVLKRGGIVGFAEPGRHHSRSAAAQHEMRNYGVLENDIILEDIKTLADGIGYSNLRVKPFIEEHHDLGYAEYYDIVQAKRLPTHVSDIIVSSMMETTVFFLHKGEVILDSRTSAGLKHSIKVSEEQIIIPRGASARIHFQITNIGPAKWLSSNLHDIGIVTLGIHLYDENYKLVDRDFYRSRFEHNISPGETVHKIVEIPFHQAGKFHLVADLVSEQVAWFENLGNALTELTVTVEQ